MVQKVIEVYKVLEVDKDYLEYKENREHQGKMVYLATQEHREEMVLMVSLVIQGTPDKMVKMGEMVHQEDLESVVNLGIMVNQVLQDRGENEDEMGHLEKEDLLVFLAAMASLDNLVIQEHQGEMAIQEETVRGDKMVHVDLMVETGKMVDRETEVLMDYLVHLELMDNLVLEEGLVHLVSVDKMAEMARWFTRKTWRAWSTWE